MTMSTYVLFLDYSWNHLPPASMGVKSRKERIEMARKMGTDIRERVIDFLKHENLMDQVEKISDPMAIATLFITCSEDVAKRLDTAYIEGVRGITKDQRVYLIDSAKQGPEAPSP